MKIKKILATLLMGLFVLTGATYANPADDRPPEQGPGPDFMIEGICNDFNLARDEVFKYLRQGVKPHDMMIAASITEISNKSLSDVLSMKTLANTWNDVEQSLGITKEQIHELRFNMIAAKTAQDVSASKDEVLNLMKSGYMPHDIAIAEILSKETQKSTSDILSMKQINNKWSDVAQSLGIDKESFRQDLGKHHIIPMREMHEPHPPCDGNRMLEKPHDPIE